jgi:hypothetical protein
MITIANLKLHSTVVVVREKKKKKKKKKKKPEGLKEKKKQNKNGSLGWSSCEWQKYAHFEHFIFSILISL